MKEKKMKIDRKELLKVLNNVKHAVADKEIIDQSDSFVFSEDGTVISFNDDIAIQAQSPLKIKGVLKAKELLSILNKTKDDTLKIKLEENEMKLYGKRSRCGLTFIKEVTLPIDEIPKADRWYDLPEDFTDAIKICLGSCGRNMNKPALTCIHLTNNRMESCDAERLSIYEFKDHKFRKETLVPYYSMGALLDLNVKRYSNGKGWIHFSKDKKNNVIISCRIYENLKYPELEALTEFKGTTLVLPKNMNEVLTRAEIFTDNDVRENMLANIKITTKKCIISSKNENGWIKEVFKMNHDGDELEFMINPVVLKDILKTSPKAVVGDRAMKFVQKNFIHAITLIQPK